MSQASPVTRRNILLPLVILLLFLSFFMVRQVLVHRNSKIEFNFTSAPEAALQLLVTASQDSTEIKIEGGAFVTKIGKVSSLSKTLKVHRTPTRLFIRFAQKSKKITLTFPKKSKQGGDTDFTSIEVRHDASFGIKSINVIGFNDLKSFLCTAIKTSSKDQTPCLSAINFKGSKFKALTDLNCSRNALTALNIADAKALTHLDCSNNQLTQLDLTNHTVLTRLDGSNNLLTSLTLPNNAPLYYLNCAKNASLSSLDCSSLNALETIDCSSCKLSTLNLSRKGSHKTLYSLDATNNPDLICIAIDQDFRGKNDSVSTQYWAYDNQVLFNNSGRSCQDINAPNTSSHITLSVSTTQEIKLELGVEKDHTPLYYQSSAEPRFTKLDLNKGPNTVTIKPFTSKVVLYGEITSFNSTNCQNITAIDASKDSSLLTLVCPSNSLTALNIANGQNRNFVPLEHSSLVFDASKNPGLSTISVDEDYTPSSDWKKDEKTVFINSVIPPGLPSITIDLDPATLNTDAELSLYFAADEVTTIYIKDGGYVTQKLISSDIERPTGIKYKSQQSTFKIYGNLTYFNTNTRKIITKVEVNSALLKELNISYIQTLAQIDLSKAPALKTLRCASNTLSTLDLSHNPLLFDLSCNSNQLSTLDLSHNPRLFFLNCSSNPLNTLDLSHNPLLFHLNCSSDQLSLLDLSYNQNISHLSCALNALTTLDLSQSPSLSYLDCSLQQNQAKKPCFTALNLANGHNKKIIYMDAENALLSCIQVDPFGPDQGWDPNNYHNTRGQYTIYNPMWLKSKATKYGMQCFPKDETTQASAKKEKTTVKHSDRIPQEMPHQNKAIEKTEQTSSFFPKNRSTILTENENLSQRKQEAEGQNTWIPSGLHCITLTTKENYDFTILLASETETTIYIEDGNFITPQTVSNDTQKPSKVRISAHHAIVKIWGEITIFRAYGLLEISNLDLSANPLLTEVSFLNADMDEAPYYLDYPHFTSLDLSHNPLLTTLACPSCAIKTLDISDNPLLTTLDCSMNELTTLDLSHNPLLTHVDCSMNELTTLDLSHNPALEMLNCTYNQLTQLDITKNTKLSDLMTEHQKKMTLDLKR